MRASSRRPREASSRARLTVALQQQLAPQPMQFRCCAQLPGFCSLLACDLDRPPKAALSFAGITASTTLANSASTLSPAIRWTRRGRPVRRRSSRRLPREKPSPHCRAGRRRAISRNQTSWFAAIAGAMTWLRVSSSGGIADAASVSVNVTGRRHGRGWRKSRSSLGHDLRSRARLREGSAIFRFELHYIGIVVVVFQRVRRRRSLRVAGV
jgi:hypothetical protein